MRVFCMGDSLTAGAPFPKEYSWPYLVAKDTGYEMINMGIDGQTSKQILDRVLQDKEFNANTESNKAIIICGGNDFIFRRSPVKYVIGNILTLCEECVKRNIEPIIGTVTLCNPDEATAFWTQFPFVNFKNVNEKIKELRDEIKSVCKTKNIKCIDLQDVYKNVYRFEDGLHPTKEGYEILAKEITRFLGTI